MNYRIEQLGKEDYEAAIDFINMVFSLDYRPTNFPELLPTYYKETEENMKCHYVIKEEGKIRALVGIYPGEMLIGDSSFRVARIGAVSTHPCHRGSGFMKTLMSHCMKVVREEGYDIANLGGLRHRYIKYGFEKCGNKLIFSLNQHNLKHGCDDLRSINMTPVKCEDTNVIQEMKKIHDNQPIKFNRKIEEFFDICSNWKHVPYAFYCDETFIGYVVANNELTEVCEFVGINEQMEILILKKLLVESEKEQLEIEAGPWRQLFSIRFGEVCEEIRVQNVENWLVLNWEKTMETLLKAKNMYCSLPNGEAVINIKGFGAVKLSKTKDKIICKKTDEESGLILEPWEAARLLFGPLEPRYSMDLPEEAKIISAWCPLPLYSSKQDFS